jgi:polyhydroxybutyrate depolymerase
LKSSRLLLAGATVLALSSAFAPALAADLVQRKLTVDGRDRVYHWYGPKELVRGELAPLVLVFHGGGGDGLGVAKLTRFAELAERERFFVAFPDGWAKNWNDGREASRIRAQRDGINDIAFVSALIDTLTREHPVDTSRIFATGISNGAIFSHYLAGHLADRIAAIAPVVGGMADPYHLRFAPSAPVSVLVIQGTDDPLVPYYGGNIMRNRGRIVSTDDTLQLWHEHNRCSTQPVNGTLPDLQPEDGCQIEWKRWTGCAAGTEVKLLRAVGGGHTWPGGKPYLPAMIVGKVCRDFDATEVIWDFFKQQPRRKTQ